MNNANCKMRKRAIGYQLSAVGQNPKFDIRNPKSPRRGILLLVVLSMLTLFLLVGTAFIVSANHYRKANKSQARATEQANSFLGRSDLLSEVINQIVRDTHNQNSVLRYHSLLRDMYGVDGLIATVDDIDITVPEITRGQMIKLFVGPNYEDLLGNQLITTENPLSPIRDAYNGLVVTFLDGPARGQSTRVVSYGPGPPHEVTVLVFALADGSPITNPEVLVNSRFLINGRPFNGTGAGYNINTTAAADPKLNAMERVILSGGPSSVPVALLPNSRFFESTNVEEEYYHDNFATLTFEEQERLKSVLGMIGRGGSDESYDVADFQNMLLALVRTDPEETTLLDLANTDPAGLGRMVLPSLHRPELLNHWHKKGTSPVDLSDPANASLLRKILLRPNWFDHPNFTGSNPEFQQALASSSLDALRRMIYGPWDVDNDNDGIRDSVWVDAGLGVITGPDGKLVKPMVALLVVDLDGRLNVNTHGSGELASPWNPTTPITVAGGFNTNDLAQGEGYGPADISLEPVVNNAQFRALLQGETIDGRDVPGRYGYPGIDGSAGLDQVFDLAFQLKTQGIPARFRTGSRLTAFGSPPDMKSRYALGLSGYGQPVYEAGSPSEVTELDSDSQYELNVSVSASRGENPTGNDSPFSVGELERVLRAFDVDAGTLSPRLLQLLTGSTTTPTSADVKRWRSLLTTDSYDLPVPSVVVPQWMIERGPDGTVESGDEYAASMGKAPTNATIADLLTYRLLEGGVPVTNLQRVLRNLLPTDLADGLRMDINRPLGNGRDDQMADPDGTPGKGIVDEPGEDEDPYWYLDHGRARGQSLLARTDTQLPAARGDFESPRVGGFRDTFDRDDNGLIEDDLERGDVTDLVSLHNYRRQQMARDLYVMAMTLVDPYALNTSKGKAKSRSLAQWAINAVDFRDADSIMTAFEYDENPFDGWDVDGDITSNSTDNAEPQRNLVWGAERPELVMTETLAWHDRRTEDESNEDPANDEDGNGRINRDDSGTVGAGEDSDYDQRRRPRGAFFLELYNPLPANPAASKDTHLVSDTLNQITPTIGQDLGVDLAAVDTTETSPVWRVMIYEQGGIDQDPDDPVLANRPQDIDGNFQADRSIYFAGFDPETIHTRWDSEADGKAFYNDRAINPVGPVRPGRYMVVGSGDEISSGVYESPLGDINPTSRSSAVGNRRLVLDTTNDLDIPSVRLIDSTDDPVQDADGFPVATPHEGMAGLEFIPNNPSYWISDVAIIDQTVGGRRRLSLSEPALGYSARVGNSQWVPSPTGEGQYEDPRSPGTPKPIDIPLDDDPLKGDPKLQQLHTEQNYRWIYLQRLANPLLPWNPEAGNVSHDSNQAVNPYLTVDSTSANVTVFNGLNEGENTTQNRSRQVWGDFASLQRGQQNDLINPTRSTAVDDNLWTMENPGLRNNRGGPTGDGRGDRSHYFPAVPDCTLGFLNKPFHNPAETNPSLKRSQPEKPFPWLTWNNRPYVSELELLQVPSVRSSQLLKAFTLRKTADERFKNDTGTNPLMPNLITDGVFRHQFNFFWHREDTAQEAVAGLYRMLEFLHVPSRYVGTEMWLNPLVFGDVNQLTSTNDPRYGRQPPFNRISMYRDPGQVNLNTIPDEDVYRGMMHGEATPMGGPNVHPGPTWDNFRDSRRGYAGGGTLELDDNAPTFFENPFRSPDAGDLVPLMGMTREGVECSLLRSDDIDGVSTATDEPLFASKSTMPHNSAERNSYFRYQPMSRLANLTTTRSNVYAVWVTIGFFEVEEAPEKDTLFRTINDPGNVLSQAELDSLYANVYPDGYMLGKEAGIETGDVVRMREFAVVDRSIPVAFEPGEDHNIERAIRLRRRIE